MQIVVERLECEDILGHLKQNTTMKLVLISTSMIIINVEPNQCLPPALELSTSPTRNNLIERRITCRYALSNGTSFLITKFLRLELIILIVLNLTIFLGGGRT